MQGGCEWPRGLCPVIGVGPGEGHGAHAKGVVSAEERERILNGVTALHAEQNAEAAGSAGGDDIGGGEAELEFGWVAGDLTVDGVDQG